MKVYRTKKEIIIEHEGNYYQSSKSDWDACVNRANLFTTLLSEIKNSKADATLKKTIESELLTPIGNQEVWASGVTYLRSREARMEESKDAGGGDFYARVYEADRPELFFKAPAYRVVGSGDKVRIRKDSKWNVPEPELTLFICSTGSIEGYTVGNDMSSRDIEGENPLYLPQAKSYDGSTAIGPCLFVAERPIAPNAIINISIQRGGTAVFENQISIDRMKRKHTELVEYLFREVTFPYGTYLMTGTGIVPPDSFTLQSGDVIRISIENIGTLENTVA
ncbi:MAG TPA: 2-hydroxyhepta-2,4-diene-1,7-dioate isomerase [Cytophagales bacterium]|nr:2-hydroxyhepta-2,4-diene-1,7-dioate isomerase [Cytophagales bacterium]HRG07378.1 fumarylacetoacetate hydrolase family protein [Cyclobacteriaceae bacterium]